MLVVCIIGFAAEARADRVVLRNGDTLTGTIASISKSGVELDTELAGHVTVKWTVVSRLSGSTPVRATTGAGDTVEGTVAVSDGRVSIQPAAGAAVGIDVDSLKTFDLATTKANAATWHGTVNAGLDFSRGNATTSTISTSTSVTRLGARDKVGLFGTYLFSSIGSGADQLTTARNTRGGLRYDHDVAGPAFAFGFGDVENDPYQLLDLRTVAGGGAGIHAIKSDTTQLNFVAGLSYAHDSYIAVAPASTTTATTPTGSGTSNAPGQSATAPGQSGSSPGKSGSAPGQQRRTGTPPAVVRTSLSRSVAEYLAGEDLTHQLSDNVSVTEGLTFFTATNDWQDYRISFDLSLSAQINGWLQWNLTVADRYLNIPPAGGAVQNDTFVTTGLGITFGRGDAGGYTGADGRPAAPPKR